MSQGSLSDLLAALAEEAPQLRGDARVIWPGPPQGPGAKPEDALDALFSEIERTVLPALLAFRTNAAAVLLHVSGRRLVAITATEGPLSPAEGLLGAPLEPEDAPRVAAAAELLAAFAALAPGTELVVRHRPPPEAPSKTADRVPVALLAQSLGRVTIDPDAPPCAQFQQRLGAQAQACIRLEAGQEAESLGEPSALAGLRIVTATQLTKFLDTRRAECVSHEDPSLTIWADAMGPGLSLGLAAIADGLLVFAFETAALCPVHQTFRRSI